MTRIKLCGLRRPEDISYVNGLLPEYIGFVFAPKSKRYVTSMEAEKLRKQLDKRITPVGVFVDEEPEVITDLLERRIIEVAQLHGNEDEEYIKRLRTYTNSPIIKAFHIQNGEDVRFANSSFADYVLLDSGGGSGETFDWSLLQEVKRPYFLAGGLTPENVGWAIALLRPYGVDASSSLERDGYKDKEKMTAFVKAVRGKIERNDRL
ncbi:MAG: phosphoribosylanthranilate isomerase [Lachnospiraceae bacterium]|nr:phosphoribosylanthranilate isomerase [Lachnospiraceae bacterium]